MDGGRGEGFRVYSKQTKLVLISSKHYIQVTVASNYGQYSSDVCILCVTSFGLTVVNKPSKFRTMLLFIL